MANEYKVTEIDLEALVVPTVTARVSNIDLETLITVPIPNARVTTFGLEVLETVPAPNARVSNFILEVLVALAGSSPPYAYLLLPGLG